MSLKPASVEAIAALSSVGRTHFLTAMTMNAQDFEHINISFSISGEDLVLRKQFKEKLLRGEPGFYADFGSADPRIGSNTYLYYACGWNGICVDANPDIAPAYKVYRPRDTFINAAIAPNDAPAFFAKGIGNVGSSRIVTTAQAPSDAFEQPAPVSNTISLRDVFDRHLPSGQKIDFMSMDLEGGEPWALRSNDWGKYRPEVIVLETQGVDSANPLAFDTVKFIADKGYACIGVLLPNVIMRRVN